MKVTSVKINRMDNNGPLKGIVSVVLDNEMVVHDIKLIITDDNKHFVSMPYFDNKTGEYCQHRDITHPINQTFRQYLEQIIFNCYYNEIVC